MNGNELKSVLEGYYDEIETAFQQKDFAAIEGYMAPVFMAYPKDDEPKDRDALMQSVRSMLSDMDVISWRRHVTNLQIEGNVATAVVEGVFKTSKGEQVLRNEDVWEQRGPAWVMVRSRALD
jgi:hypothetical protein